MTATDEMFHHFACHPATSTAFVQPLLLCLTLSVSRLSHLTVSMFSLASSFCCRTCPSGLECEIVAQILYLCIFILTVLFTSVFSCGGGVSSSKLLLKLYRSRCQGH